MSLSALLVERLQSWLGVAGYFAVWSVLLVFAIEVYARILAKLAALEILRTAGGFIAYLAISCVFVLPLLGLGFIDQWRELLHADPVFYAAFILGYICSLAPAMLLFHSRRMPQLRSLGYFQPRHRPRR